MRNTGFGVVGLAACFALSAFSHAALAANPYEPRFYNYAPPSGVGESAGEPSIGYNLVTGKGLFIANLTTLRITFPERVAPEGSIPATCDADWEDVSTQVTHTRTLDPILFTDQATGRTFVSQLNSVGVGPALLPMNSLMAYSDNDGDDWQTAQVNPPDGSNDHQTVGSGPYPEALAALRNDLNDGRAVYYCAQGGAALVAASAAFCSRSDDGGLNFGRAIPVYTGAVGCSGASQMIHGHVKVAPDGTVYLPNAVCGGRVIAAVSTDAGMTWAVRPIPNTLSPTDAILDPSVAIGKDPPVAPAASNTTYVCYTARVPGAPPAETVDNHAFVSVTKDRGLTWSTPKDLGAAFGIKNAVFAEAIAGDSDRAACAFIGTTTSGDHQADGVQASHNTTVFHGTWYGYVAYTYDSGNTWTTVLATPNGPVQRDACIWNKGGNVTCRNLADFNEVTMDEKGRVLFAYADGCVDQCEQGGANTYSSKATIARQSGGKSLLSQFDAELTAVGKPDRPCVSGKRDDMASYLKWRAPDPRGSDIAEYRVYRGIAPAGAEAFLGKTSGNDTTFADRSADPTVGKYSYKVTAANGNGESLFSNRIELVQTPRVEDIGACATPGAQALMDPAGDATNPLPAFDITSVSMAEVRDPNDPTGHASKLTFTLKVANLDVVPPGWRWAVRFSAPQKPPNLLINNANTVMEDWFVSMVTSDGATPTFTYGETGVPGGAARIFNTLGTLDASSKYYADGRIELVLPKSAIGNPQPGQAIVGMLGSVRATIPSAIPGSGGTNDTIPDSTGGGAYTLRANNLCLPNNAPVARMTISEEEGEPPFTVQFDASASSDADEGVDTIGSYTFNFGDGGDDVTKLCSGPADTECRRASYVYNNPGVYIARLVVNDSRGRTSSNTAQATIVAHSLRPSPFGFAEQTGVPLNAFVTSEPVTLTGFTGELPLTISNSGQFSIDGGAFASGAGGIYPGHMLRVRHVSASVPNTVMESTVTVGDYATVFRSTTSAADSLPDAFSFIDRTGVATNVFITSEGKTIAGIDVPVSVSIANGQYSIDGGAFTSTAGTIMSGQILRVRHVSAATPGTETRSTVTVGSGTPVTLRSVTSTDDRTPDAFGFDTQTGVDPGVVITSNTITPAGYNVAVSVVPGAGLAYRINGGAFVTGNGTMSPGDTLTVRHTSSTTAGGYTKTSIKVGGVTAYFTTRTR